MIAKFTATVKDGKLHLHHPEQMRAALQLLGSREVELSIDESPLQSTSQSSAQTA